MYIFLTLTSLFFQIIPRGIALLIGRMMGSFFYLFVPIRKTIAIKNLDIAFPKWSINKKKSILHLCYCHYGMIFIDFLRLPRYKRKKNHILVNIPKSSYNLLKKHNGGIIMSGHIGNWEYIGPSLGINGIDCAGVAQIQHNNTSNYFFNKLRASKNVKIIPVDGGSKVMIDAIKSGSYLGLISDQNAGKRGIEVQFFNEFVSVPKGAGAFHLKTNSPILLGFCILSTNFNYDLSFYELDLKNLPIKSNEAIREINQRYSNILEKIIKQYPQQYFWFHRKWKKYHYKGLSNY